MADCEKLAKCPFFNDQMANMPSMSNVYKQSFCRGDSSKCARLRVSKAGQQVPADLYPNQKERADSLLRQA